MKNLLGGMGTHAQANTEESTKPQRRKNLYATSQFRPRGTICA